MKSGPGRKALRQDMMVRIWPRQQRVSANSDPAVDRMLHVNAAVTKLKHGLRHRDVKRLGEVGQFNEIPVVAAMVAEAHISRNAPTHGLNPLYLEHKVAFRSWLHCPLVLDSSRPRITSLHA